MSRNIIRLLKKNLSINESSNIFNQKHIKCVIIKINFIDIYMLTFSPFFYDDKPYKKRIFTPPK